MKNIYGSFRHFHIDDRAQDLKVYPDVIERIWSRLADEKSKMIFQNRLLFSLTLDYYYVRNMVLDTSFGRDFYNILKNFGKPLYIYCSDTYTFIKTFISYQALTNVG